MKLKKKTIKNLSIALVIIITLSFGANSLFFKADPAKVELAQCLTDKGVKMYGAFWCGACASQKKEFGSAFKEINYIECDERGEDAQPEVCKLEEITVYPTWEINGQKSSEVKSLASLAATAGCKY